MKRWEKNLYSLWLAQFITAMGLSMILPFLPFFLRDLGITETQSVKIWSGFIYAAPFMISAFMQPVWGMLGDRKGRKIMVVRAMAALFVAHVLMGFSQSATQLLILRFFQGSLSGFVAPSLALMASCAPEERTGQALGTLQSSLVTGMVGGPLLGGLLAHIVGYRPLFFGTAFLCFCGMMTVILFVKEDFVPQAKKDRSSVIDNLRYVTHTKELRALLLLLIMTQSSTVLVAPFLSLFVESLKVNPAHVGLMTGLVFGITGMVNAVFAPYLGRKSDQIGPRKILRFSLIGVTLISLPQAFVTNIYQLIILRGGLGVFFSGIIPTVNTIIRRSTSGNNQGGIFGIFQSGLVIGNVTGPLVGGVLSASLGLRSIFLISTGIYGLALLWERIVLTYRHHSE